MKLSPLLLVPALAALAFGGLRADLAVPPAADVTPAASAEADDRDEAALARVNAMLRADPRNASAYIVRGNIYGDRQMLGLAQEDYEAALGIDPTNLMARANLAELRFRQKEYDRARVDFAALESVQQIRDLADYKVFLCDLFGAHETVAKQELAVFTAADENASYYFGNIAWDLVHHESRQARDYLASAEEIYAPRKVELYAASLLELGYLPLPEAR